MKPTLILHARELRKHAKKIADGIARANPGGCCVIARPAPNPTLVAHGLVKASRWHIVTHDPPRRAVADLYAGSHAEAARVTRLLANMISSNGGRPVTLDLLDNRATPAQLRAHPKSSIASNPDDRTHLQGLNTREQALYAERGLRGVGIGTCGVEKRGKRWHVLIDRGAPLGPKLRSRANPSRSKAARARRKGVLSHRQRRSAAKAGWQKSAQTRHLIIGQIRRGTKRGLPHGRSPNPKGRFSVRRVDDLVKSPTHGDYTQGIWEVVDSAGKVVFRSYNQRDARTEAAYRNKHDPRGAFTRARTDHPSRNPARPRGSLKGLTFPKVRADSLKVGDMIMPPERELRLWMIRDAAEKGLRPDQLGVMLTAVKEGASDKGGRWILLTGYLRDEWYKGPRGPYPMTFKARPDTPWPVVAKPTESNRRAPNPKGRKRIAHATQGGYVDKTGHVVLTSAQLAGVPKGQRAKLGREIAVAIRKPIGMVWLPVRIANARGGPNARTSGLRRRHAARRSDHRTTRRGRAVGNARGGGAGVVAAHAQVEQAIRDWQAGHTYIDARGNYHIRDAPAHPSAPRGRSRIAPWNKAVKAAMTVSQLHEEAQRRRGLTASGKPLPNPKGRIGTRQKARRVAVGAARGRRSRRVPNRLPSTRPRKYLGWSIERHRFTDAGVETFARFAYGPNGERVIESSGHEPTAEAAIRKHVRDIVEGSREAPALTLTRMSPRGNPRGRFNARRNSRKKGGRSAATAARRRPRARASHSAATRHPNPASRDSAAKLVRMFEDRGPIKVKHTRTRSPKPMSGAVAKIGDVVAVTYRSKKFDGKSKDYEHEFKSPKPLLVADPSSGDLNLVRGKSRYGLTPDGIIN